MDVRMHTIMAGPSGCADAGAVISLPDAEAKRLIDAKYAVKAQFPARETAMINPAVQEQLDRDKAKAAAEAEAAEELRRKAADAVEKALSLLDRADDEDWTSSGKPGMDRVKQLTGSATLTRSELDVMFPDFRRGEPSSDPAATGQGAAMRAEAAATKSGARSNKP